jgi:DNA-binding HxlR family transcriptional regulator
MTQFPYELCKAIEGLNNRYRQNILLILNKSDKMSFSEIKKEIPISRPLLANHLKTLSRTLLIDHFFEHELGNDKFSYYRMSPFGKVLLENIMGTLEFEYVKEAFTYFHYERTAVKGAFGIPLIPNSKTSQNESSAAKSEISAEIR